MQVILTARLIVVDDIGLLPVSPDAAEGFFRLVDAAYEKRSVAVSSNVHPAAFDELMPKTLATATVDRLLHHAHVNVFNELLPPVHQAGAGRVVGDGMPMGAPAGWLTRADQPERSVRRNAGMGHRDQFDGKRRCTARTFARRGSGGALRAFIHRSQTWCPRRERRKRNRMPLSPGGLPAGWLAEALSANRYKFGPAHTAGDRYAIVTQRNLRHCRPPSRSGGRQAKAGCRSGSCCRVAPAGSRALPCLPR